ncbi:alpha/beta hydrolase [Alkalibacterium olivapovliticus]|uniref:Acetyl esterase/lipase n=1 Tax=Alkalibacterium olivapovliticus TaxID=99907 RepID=A0A2T0W6H2_9LACT|nr:alpha/beta hydrolase [Alkalibacterium olivapovliticus]PRY82289.1 acetyl esterase/lipase [Alkalibacterium olivapovliticus]
MNPLFKFILRLVSSPKIDIQEDYQSMRRMQRFFARNPQPRYRFLDEKIYTTEGNHEIPVRIFYPKEKRHNGAVLYVHGGGWVIGDIESYSRTCINLADSLGRIVYSVDYRLAPEAPYPAGLNDCLRVAEVLMTEIEGEEERDWIFMGDSAGANLIAAVSLVLRDNGRTLPGKQVLIYPVTYWDHTEASPFESIKTNGYEYGLTIKKIQEYMELYAPDMSIRKSPTISPLMADNLSEQPDTLVITAEFDPLRDEGEMYGKALEKAGNSVRIHRVLNAVHGFITYPKFTEPVEETIKVIKEFLGQE